MANPKGARASQSMDVDVRRSRSFGGCGTCRNRRMKCDEKRPACSTCKTSGLTCSGYEKSIFFDCEETPSVGTARFRRPLLTEMERECMSKRLISSISPALTLWHIAQIEDECERLPLSQDVQISRGPFGVFRVPQFPSEPPKSDSEPSPRSNRLIIENSWQDEQGVYEDTPEETDGNLMAPQGSSPSREPRTDPVEDSSDPKSLSPIAEWWSLGEWWDLPNAGNWWDTPLGQERIQDISSDISFPEVQQSPRALMASQDICVSSIFAELQPKQLSTPESSLVTHKLDYAVPHDAVFLLKHYSTTVLRGFTPFRHSKTPWHILFIPYVKSCLAALTLGEEMDHASLTAFFGTLSMSASSLGGISNSRMWCEQAESYKQRARHHVRLMLQTAYDIPKTAKYKSILIALLTMVQISSISGNRDQIECYLLEAEKFIRVRGLNKKKSRKVRLLHHCYAFERILHETTFPGSTRSPHRLHVRHVIESSNAIAYSQDSLSFQLINWSNLDQEMMKVKGQDEGENDLHLQLPGIWLATLYPEIFGIPEVHVFLLSLIIRLARAKDGTEYSGSTGVAEFLSRAKAVEKCVHQLKRTPGYDVADLPTTDPQMQHCQQQQSHLALAMRLAVTIYFYRRVYDVEANMLQDKVLEVRDCLLRFEATESEMGYGSARLVWPAVIAAREAEDPEVQLSFARWFKDWSRRSGLRIFSDSLTDVEKWWNDKRGVQGNVELIQV